MGKDDRFWHWPGQDVSLRFAYDLDSTGKHNAVRTKPLDGRRYACLLIEAFS